MSFAALLAFDASSAWACSCAEPPEPDVAIASADVVFEGTPRDTRALEADLGLSGYRGARRFDFEVTRYFKGQLGPDVSVFTVDQSSACGREYPLDEPYIIYARYSDSGLLTDFACSRSRPTSFSSDDSPFLGAGVAPDPELASPDDEDDGTAAEEVSSGIHRVPLDTEPEARGCAASLAQMPLPPERSWLAAIAGLALVALGMRRRSPR